MESVEAILGVDYAKYACNVELNGIALSENYQILSVQVKHGYQYISSAQILLKTNVGLGDPMVSNPFEVPVTGSKIKIKAKLGFENIDIFEGTVVYHKFKNSVAGSRIQLTAKCKAINLAVNKKSEIFAKLSDKEVIEQLVQENGCQFKTQNITTQFTLKHSQLVKNELTDWDFINLRAEANGCYVFCENDEVKLDRPTMTLDPTKLITAKYGSNVFEIEIEQDDRKAQVGHEIVSFNLANFENEVSKEDPSLTSGPIVPINGKAIHNNYRQFNEREADQLLNAETTLKTLSKNSGTIQIKANLQAKTGQTLEVSGFNDYCDGKYIISSVMHDYSEGGFSTYLQFGLHFESFETKYGLRSEHDVPKIISGSVVQLEQDPDNLHRILVKISHWNQAQENLWCRLSSFYAGDQHGFFCLPEIGDEVIVAFMGTDCDNPVVLGSMFSPQKPPHTNATDDNFEKVLITKKGMKWAWNDEKGIHEISTQSGNKIVISQKDKSITIEDENQNKIVMNNEEISLSASKDINIKANANVSIEGGKIDIKSSGLSTIKGSIVQIN